MDKVDLRCRCERWARRCTNRMSQEDARCDICRGDKCGYVGAGDWFAHCQVVDQTFEVRI